jgi:hypothetical protein
LIFYMQCVDVLTLAAVDQLDPEQVRGRLRRRRQIQYRQMGLCRVYHLLLPAREPPNFLGSRGLASATTTGKRRADVA